MEYVKFNANLNILVRLKDKGIEHIVVKHNDIMPFKHHTSFNEYKKRANEFGYFTFQLWNFLDLFGDLGMRSCDYFDIDIVFMQKDFEPFEFKQLTP